MSLACTRSSREKNDDAARRAIKSIREGVRVLAAHPDVGRPINDLPAAYRDWPTAFGDSGYLVRYRHNGNTVLILAVHHMKETGFPDPG